MCGKISYNNTLSKVVTTSYGPIHPVVNFPLKFFLGLQVSQPNKGIFISQTKYIKDMLKKFNMEDSKPVSIPMITDCKLIKDDKYLEVDHTMYRYMIGSILYVTTTRPYVIQTVGFPARLQLAPKETHVTTVK